MSDDSQSESVAKTMRAINQVWLDGRIEELGPLVHPEIVMVIPGFAAGSAGREAFLQGFRDFREQAAVHEFTEGELRIDVAGRTAVVTYTFEMIYERSGERYRATGRDLWVFENRGEDWLAVWRTMLDMSESPV